MAGQEAQPAVYTVSQPELSSGFQSQHRREITVPSAATGNLISQHVLPPCGTNEFQPSPKVGLDPPPVSSFQAINPGVPTEQPPQCAVSQPEDQASHTRGYQAQSSGATSSSASLGPRSLLHQEEPPGGISHQGTWNQTSTSEPYLRAPLAYMAEPLGKGALHNGPHSSMSESVASIQTPLSPASSIPGHLSRGFQVPGPVAYPPSMSRSILCRPSSINRAFRDGWADGFGPTPSQL